MKDQIMNRNDLFPPKYLKAADVGQHTPKVTIARVQLEELGDAREKKAVVYFDGNPRGLVLNKTNYNSIASVCGSDDTDTWTGREIQLCTEMVAFKGQSAPAIRVCRPAAAPQIASPPWRPGRAPAPVRDDARDELNEEIPF